MTLLQNIIPIYFIDCIVLIGSGEQEMARALGALVKYMHAEG